MKIYYILSLLVALIYLLSKSKKAMHMLQQNWYNEDDRYINWIFNNQSKVFIGLDLLFIVFLFLKGKVLIISFVLYFIILYYINSKKVKDEQTKKPLVYTPRVKRLFICEIIVYTILAYITTIMWYNELNMSFYCFYIGLIIYLNYLFLYLCNIINKPIEKMVFNHYKRMAKNKLESMTNLKKVAITGSYGKTTTKNVLNEILNVKYNSYATEKSFNTFNGLMISINNKLDKFTDVFISEMGASSLGEIKPKTEFIKPEYGILTIIGTAHLESFGSIENIQKTKFELIEGLDPNGVAILNMDDEYQTSYKIKNTCKKVWVSMKNKKADVYADNIKLSSKGTSFMCHFKNKKVLLETKLLGSANIYNVLQSVALAYEMGLTLEQIALGVKRVKPVEHRLELKKYGEINIIDDAYNSNPVGSKMAVDVLGLMDGKKIIVTPGMIELGEKQYELNYEFGRHIARVCDEVILIGEEQTKPILDGLKKEKYDMNCIHILNDVKESFPLMRKLSDKNTYVLLENDLPDIFNE